MKEYKVRISDKLYRELNSEAFAIALAYPDGASMSQKFIIRVFKAWSAGEVPELKLKTEANENAN